MAGVLPLIRDLCDLDDQRRVLGGLVAAKLHAIGPRSERYGQTETKRERQFREPKRKDGKW